MASVTSLDKDLRKLRLDKYTPTAAKEVSSWIEGVLGERLPSGDLLEGLKDGVALCKLINLAIPSPGVKFKKSAMPFVQMENISHFLRACKQPPLNLQDHDVFLTVDLFEQKDPAQVLQCLGAFSRAAHAAKPANFPSPIGKSRGVMSPQGTGRGTPSPTRSRGLSNASGFGSPRPNLSNAKTGDSGSGRWSPTKPTSPVSSWSRKEHEGATSPAWNIAQYGYMGGASQGNLGISFGSRRQITSAGPSVPSLAEKETRRKVKEAEEDRQRQQMEEHRRQEEEELEREARLREEREIQRLVEEKQRQADQERRQWEEEERMWKLTEEKRRKEEAEAETRLAEERTRARSKSDARLRGQFLSQYQSEQGIKPQKTGADRIAELEKELEEARERERRYELERQGRPGRALAVTNDPKARLRSRSRPSDGTPSRQDSWSRNEREVLQTAWSQHQEAQDDDEPPAPPPRSPRPLPDPMVVAQPPQNMVAHTTGGRPLPDPAAYKAATQAPPSRTDRFLASNAAPASPAAKQTYSRELSATAEQDAEDRRRAQSQNKTKAGGWASKSLLEREMEMERERQREWEEAQKETAKAVPAGNGVDGIGGGIGGRWDVSQWSGYTGGDNQNKGAQGIGAGRRQIVGPRPLPNVPR
ncbi:Transgelin [Colletotrichum tanaceti]|uniref:Transgelin n=1 Tax=Colletotrichum tanaceti TaxID=1306861 RepID=A0A4U6X9D0_9PEZI|nr:Transgelin [Colletotrichum tanaceti]TKW51874.1 Transgelin [Colletotrichum tanaceti]